MVYRRGKAFPLLSFSVIEAAVSEEPNAIDAVLAHYGRYIAALSVRTVYNESGSQRLCVDEELRRRLEVRRIAQIIRFDLNTTA